MGTEIAAIGTLLSIEGPDSYKELNIGLKEGGEIKLKVFFDPLDRRNEDAVNQTLVMHF